MNTVYVLFANYNWTQAKFYSTKKKASDALDKIRKEILVRGVEVLKNTDTEFEFIFGWQESHVLWKIVDVPVE